MSEGVCDDLIMHSTPTRSNEMKRRIRKSKPRTRRTDDLIELRPHVYLFTPAWAKK